MPRPNRIVVAALVAIVVATSAADARQARPAAAEGLVRIVQPAARAEAHPFVNLEVAFGGTTAGAEADPSTLRATLNGRKITALLSTFTALDGTLRARARLEAPLLRIGRGKNRLVLKVRSVRKGQRVAKDVDKLVFRAAEGVNHPPVAQLGAAVDVIVPGTPVAFDAGESTDPDGDALSFQWDFGDGTASTDARPSHLYAANAGPVTVRLSVSDGQDTGTAEKALGVATRCDASRSPGVLRVDATGPLEFGGVAVGTAATRPLTLRNVSEAEGSQVKVDLASDASAFALDVTQVSLGPGEARDVVVRFLPVAAGHQHALIALSACAANVTTVTLPAHGFGGAAPGTGPTLASTTAFHGPTVAGILPNGTRFEPDLLLRSCYTSAGGLTFSQCTRDQDCPSNGTCPAVATCPSGPNLGQSCTTGADCPQSFCPTENPITALDFCGDGQGNVYLLTDEGAYEDPSPGEDEELSQTVVRLDLDAAGNTTGKTVLRPVYGQTEQIACDAVVGAPGRVFLAQHRGFSAEQCFRDEREDLVGVRKTSGDVDLKLHGIDGAEGLDQCQDELDPVDNLAVSRDGRVAYASFGDNPDTAGVYVVWTDGRGVAPLRVLEGSTPSVLSGFRVHPDGSVVVATTSDTGTTGIVNLYKAAPELAASGPLRLEDLSPCGTFAVPNNGARTVLGESYAVDVSPSGGLDGVALVSFTTTVPVLGAGETPPVSRTLAVRGTVAFASPAGSAACTPLGLVNLEFLDPLVF